MDLAGKVIVVTGAASGIGAAIARRCAAERPAGVIVADIDEPGAEKIAAEVEALGAPARGVRVDVTSSVDVAAMVVLAEATFGPIDVFVQNAGIAVGGGFDATDAEWDAAWKVNVLSHVIGARAVVPGMIERGGGYLVHTVSAAGMLSAPGAAPYSVTKHAALAFAEQLAYTHKDQGIRVSALCPMGVNTPLLMNEDSGLSPTGQAAVLAAGNVIEPEDVADVVIDGIRSERFLMLPHPEAAQHEHNRITDRDAYISAMAMYTAFAADQAAGGDQS